MRMPLMPGSSAERSNSNNSNNSMGSCIKNCLKLVFVLSLVGGMQFAREYSMQLGFGSLGRSAERSSQQSVSSDTDEIIISASAEKPERSPQQNVPSNTDESIVSPTAEKPKPAKPERSPQQNLSSDKDESIISAPTEKPKPAKPERSPNENVPSNTDETISPSTEKPKPTQPERSPQKNESIPAPIEKPKPEPIQIQPAKQIILLGERHSGTNWITDHLKECFQEDIKVTNQYARFKHWFQDEDLSKIPENSAVVIALFRDPYDWVEAMRVEPHHSHDHVDWPTSKINYNIHWKDQGARSLPWKKFVTKPWTSKRGPTDKKIIQTPGAIANATCLDRYSYWDIVPCSPEDSPYLSGLNGNKYELQHDGSERAYSSIVDLRRAKIMNHFSVADFPGTRAFLPYRFEDLNVNGTAELLRNMEQATGLKANCKATLGKARRLGKKKIIKHRELPDDYIQWMNRFVDWEAEGRIGYYRKDGKSSTQDVATTSVKPKTKPTKPVKQIILLGERHGGTNWITDHLRECFQEEVKVTNEYTRFKHWFQNEDLSRVPENSAVVVSLFRDPYDWVEAMRVEPHHAHDHVDWPTSKINYDIGWTDQGARPLPWKKFVTKPWEGKRGPMDKHIAQTPGGIKNASCLDRYSYWDVAPCSPEDQSVIVGLAGYKYELQHDGSAKAYSSIIDLRRAKIMNHLSVADFLGTRAFFQYRFEDLNVNGTAKLLQAVEQATGLKAKCKATKGKARRLGEKAIIKHRELPDDYIQWMNGFVDWEVESRIGYYRRE